MKFLMATNSNNDNNGFKVGKKHHQRHCCFFFFCMEKYLWLLVTIIITIVVSHTKVVDGFQNLKTTATSGSNSSSSRRRRTTTTSTTMNGVFRPSFLFQQTLQKQSQKRKFFHGNHPQGLDNHLLSSPLTLLSSSSSVSNNDSNNNYPIEYSNNMLSTTITTAATTTTTDGTNGNSSSSSSNNNNANNSQKENQIIHGQEQDDDSLGRFSKDVTRLLKEIRGGPDRTIPEMFRESYPELSMTYVWNDLHWNRQMSRTRYIREIFNSHKSRLVIRIVPQVSVTMAWSFLVSTLIAKYGSDERAVLEQFFNFSIKTLSLVSTFVAALLTLRSNQGLTRLRDARSAWGRLISVCRDTAQVLAVSVYPKNPKLALLAARHLSIFGWLLKCRLREDDDSDIINAMLPSQDAKFVSTNQRKHGAASIHRLRQIVGYMAINGQLTQSTHSRLESNFAWLHRIYGRCERVKGSCIPPLYTAHVTRLLVFYLFFLPFALSAGKTIQPISTTLITGAAAFAMMGLDEIGHILEQPFRKMPLQEQAGNAMKDVADAFVRQPPPLPALQKDNNNGDTAAFLDSNNNNNNSNGDVSRYMKTTSNQKNDDDNANGYRYNDDLNESSAVSFYPYPQPPAVASLNDYPSLSYSDDVYDDDFDYDNDDGYFTNDIWRNGARNDPDYW